MSLNAPLQVTVPPEVLSAAAVVLVSALVAVVVVTLGYSLRAARTARRRTERRAQLRAELLDRQYGRDDPEWGSWVESLSAAERTELESLLAVYLRELDGRDARRLAELGSALGIDERSRRDIATGDYWDRLHALTWLALLRDPPDRDLLADNCLGSPRERAAAARVLYAGNAPDLATTGVDLLLGDEPAAFSVFGIDTLYRVAESDPSPLLARAAADFDDWEPALQQQVLLATRHLHTVVGDLDLSWVVGALNNPEERVRVSAWRALESYGWNPQVRAQVDLSAAAADPSPVVRANAYRLLGAWGDGDALATLRAAAGAEPDGRTQVAAADALLTHRRPGTESPVPEGLDEAWQWAGKHAEFDAVARELTTDRRVSTARSLGRVSR